MLPPSFAQVGGGHSWFTSFCNEWGNIASVLGFVLSLLGLFISAVGFLLTWRKIRRAAQEAARRVSLQLAAADVATLLRLIEGARDAARQERWERAIDRCQEARHVAMSLAYNRCLTEDESASMRVADDELRAVIQYVENRRLPEGAAAGNLPANHRRTLDRLITTLGEIKGRLQHAAPEV
jgi:hypothetical protein